MAQVLFGTDDCVLFVGSCSIVNTMAKGGYGKGDMAAMMKIFQSMFGKGKGKGKGKGRMSHRNFAPEKKIWFGNLPEGLTRQELHAHMLQTEGCKWVEIFKDGQGVACFLEAEKATLAISTMNGSVLNGQAIEVDVWTKKDAN